MYYNYERKITNLKESIELNIIEKLNQNNEFRSFHVLYDIVSQQDLENIQNDRYYDEAERKELAFNNINSKCDFVHADTAHAAEQKVINKYKDSKYHVFNFKVIEIGVNLYG